MKTLITITFIICVLKIGVSQPIIDSSDFNVDFNKKYVIKNAFNYHTIENGSNITWDFTDFDTSFYQIDTVEFTILDSLCNGLFLPGGYYYGAYPNSNMHIKRGNVITNQENSNSGLYLEGGGVCNSHFGFYTDMLKIMDFPFSFNSATNDFYEGEVPDFPSPYNYFTGNVNILANGYGTLILPNITFNNVLKISTVKTYQNPPIPSDTNYIDTWYCPNIPYPVLEITNFWNVKYMDDLITKIDNIQVFDNSFNVYPVPAEESIILDLNGIEINFNYSIIDLYGNSVTNGITNKNKIDIQDLKTGIYFLRIESNGKHITRKIIKK